MITVAGKNEFCLRVVFMLGRRKRTLREEDDPNIYQSCSDKQWPKAFFANTSPHECHIHNRSCKLWDVLCFETSSEFHDFDKKGNNKRREQYSRRERIEASDTISDRPC